MPPCDLGVVRVLFLEPGLVVRIFLIALLLRVGVLDAREVPRRDRDAMLLADRLITFGGEGGGPQEGRVDGGSEVSGGWGVQEGRVDGGKVGRRRARGRERGHRGSAAWSPGWPRVGCGWVPNGCWSAS